MVRATYVTVMGNQWIVPEYCFGKVLIYSLPSCRLTGIFKESFLDSATLKDDYFITVCGAGDRLKVYERIY
jgi:hypothetical protein